MGRGQVGGRGSRPRTVDVQEDHDARQQQLKLPLDDGTLVLPGAPDVAPADGEEHRGGSWRMKKGRALDMAYRNRW